VRRLFHDGPLQLRVAPEALELALRPSPRLRLARRALAIAVLLYLLELLLTGHRIAALAIALLVACSSWPWMARVGTSPAMPQRLVLATDGRLFLEHRGGSLEEVRLRPESLRLGSHVLLVLTGAGRTIRLLLGPDNLAPAQLAALQRRLPAGSAPPATALHSPAASRRSDPP
jgi:hypothetical protein